MESSGRRLCQRASARFKPFSNSILAKHIYLFNVVDMLVDTDFSSVLFCQRLLCVWQRAHFLNVRVCVHWIHRAFMHERIYIFFGFNVLILDRITIFNWRYFAVYRRYGGIKINALHTNALIPRSILSYIYLSSFSFRLSSQFHLYSNHWKCAFKYRYENIWIIQILIEWFPSNSTQLVFTSFRASASIIHSVWSVFRVQNDWEGHMWHFPIFNVRSSNYTNALFYQHPPPPPHPPALSVQLL